MKAKRVPMTWQQAFDKLYMSMQDENPYIDTWEDIGLDVVFKEGWKAAMKANKHRSKRVSTKLK